MQDGIRLNENLSIPRGELDFKATRSGGPGGQHVNTSSTRIELTWDVSASLSLTEDQKSRIRERLANRIDDRGVLHLTASSSRSQHQNREEAIDRFARLIADALRVRKKRKKTKPPKAAKEARLRSKKRRSYSKKLRGKISDE